MKVRYSLLSLLCLVSALIDAKMTQTEAYLSIYEGLVQSLWQKELEVHKDLIDTCLQRERAHLDSHYVFYHSQQGQFSLFRDVLKELYRLSYNVSLPPNFEFTRLWNDALATVDANSFIDQEEQGYHWLSWHDNQAYLRDKFVSVNLSLFANANNPWECTFHYFLNNMNIVPPDISVLLDTVFSRLKLDQRYKKKFLELADQVTARPTLIQIFIPKQLVDQCMYLAYKAGTPYRKKCTDSFDPTKNRHRDLSSILDLYQTNPSKLGQHLDTMQARIIVSQDIILNPHSGVIMYTYSKDPQANPASYNNQLKRLVACCWKIKLKM